MIEVEWKVWMYTTSFGWRTQFEKEDESSDLCHHSLVTHSIQMLSVLYIRCIFYNLKSLVFIYLSQIIAFFLSVQIQVMIPSVWSHVGTVTGIISDTLQEVPPHHALADQRCSLQGPLKLPWMPLRELSNCYLTYHSYPSVAHLNVIWSYKKREGCNSRVANQPNIFLCSCKEPPYVPADLPAYSTQLSESQPGHGIVHMSTQTFSVESSKRKMSEEFFCFQPYSCFDLRVTSGC